MNLFPQRALVSALLAAVVWFASLRGYVWIAVLAILIVELPSYRRLPKKDELLAIVPELAAGLSVALLISLFPRALTQVGLAVAYAIWRWYLIRVKSGSQSRMLAVTLVSQVLVFEALFLSAAIQNPPRLLILVAIWLTSFILVYAGLSGSSNRAAPLLAAAWALVAAQASWIFLSWLVSYVVVGGYIIVPQPAIVLGGLAYCAGSIYLAQKQSELTRGRLTEYVLITLVLMLIVIAGTPWKGTI